MKPLVAIVGRPNVGKSMLFNKLIGQRLSIVEDTPGVTRDRIYGESEWCGRKFRLVDTGGIEPRTDDQILSFMREQAEIAIQHADVIIFLTDVKTGLTASDQEVANMLLRSRKPIVLAVNKMDSTGRVDPDFYEFYNLGLGDPIAVSAVHGHGTGDLLDACLQYFPPEDDEEEDEDVIKVAIIGKPNVGKSSLTNRILGTERMIVSNVAGTTRDAIDSYFENEQGKYVFIDTAGIRDTSDTVEHLGVERSFQAAQSCQLAFFVVDGSKPLTPEDEAAMDAALQAPEAIAILNKQDLPCVIDPCELPFSYVIPVSCAKQEGLDLLEQALDMVFDDEAPCDGSILTNARQADAIAKSRASIEAALSSLRLGMTPDAVLVDVEAAMEALGEATGRVVREDITNRIFERFCVGK